VARGDVSCWELILQSNRKTNIIEVKVRDLSQLFNSMDPSPFHEKDLDHDAEEFIVSWAMEFPHDEDLGLLVYLEEPPSKDQAQQVVADAVHHFFAYQAQLKRRELRELISRGRTSLVIGLVFLALSLAAGQWISHLDTKGLGSILQESLLIGGWVAMWRPMQIFLHDWWPVARLRKLYDKMSAMDVQVRTPASENAANYPPHVAAGNIRGSETSSAFRRAASQAPHAQEND